MRGNRRKWAACVAMPQLWRTLLLLRRSAIPSLSHCRSDLVDRADVAAASNGSMGKLLVGSARAFALPATLGDGDPLPRPDMGL
eukprot:1419350-Pyramimonas_sp.AAC.1